MTDETTPIKEPPSPEQPVVPPAQANNQPAKKPIYKKWWFWVIVVLVIAAIGSTADGDNDVAEEPVEEPAVTEAVSEPEPEAEPAPDPEPEPEPEPTIQEIVDGAFGSFEALSEEGSGDGTINLPEGVVAGLVTATHAGGSNFAIHTIDSNNENLDLLVNEIGNYAGTTLYDDRRGQPARLRISAGGGWTVTVSPVSSAEVMEGTASGRGDTVLLYDGGAADFAISHEGSSNFAVTMHGNDQGLIVNEIGSYQGTIPVRGGPAVIEIKADGDWSIEVR